jgi:hypothetical protein
MVYNTQDCWVFGLRSLSGILKNTKEHKTTTNKLRGLSPQANYTD